MKNCIFCEIVTEDKEKFVYEDENFIGFLDHRPLFPGHVLLIPKEHFQTIYVLPDSLHAGFINAGKKIGHAVQTATQSEGTFLAMNNIVSQSVPHLHLHIVPRKKGDGLKGFFWPRAKYASEEEMLNWVTLIKRAL